MPLETNKQTLGAVGLLMLLFCAFFWIGYFAGKGAAKAPAAAAVQSARPVPVEKAAPAAETSAGGSVRI